MEPGFIKTWGTMVVGVLGALIGATVTVLYPSLGLLGLAVIWLLVVAAVAVAVALHFAAKGPAQRPIKVVGDYRVQTAGGLVYRVLMKVQHKTDEPWLEAWGPFCADDLSRMVLQLDDQAYPFLPEDQIPRYWICPTCPKVVPWKPDEERLVKGFALGKWNRGEPSDWRSFP